MMVDMMVMDAAVLTEEEKMRKREALEYRGVKHASQVEFAKTLIRDIPTSEDREYLDLFFKVKAMKAALLTVLIEYPQEFPELDGDIKQSALYYLFSLRENSTGTNHQSKSLQMLRAIQEACKVKSLDEVASLAEATQNSLNCYEFILRCDREPEKKEEYRELYQRAVLVVLRFMSEPGQKLKLFLQGYGEGDVNQAVYQEARSEIKKIFRSRNSYDALFYRFARHLIADGKYSDLIHLIAVADRRKYLNELILNKPDRFELLNDELLERKNLFSEHKLRRLIDQRNGIALPKKSFFKDGLSLFSFLGKNKPRDHFEMSVKLSAGY